jgi:hypothetical protein
MDIYGKHISTPPEEGRIAEIEAVSDTFTLIKSGTQADGEGMAFWPRIQG